ncbi:MAG: M56 family metallopeptidase [Lachnospiraceae bacterium]|nr:M56 family metallopeptidase [Lachnospiraceae bacterium]
MTDIFLAVLETTLSSSVVILLLLLLMPFLNRRYAAKWSYYIWIFLAVRLIVPFSLYDIVGSYPVHREEGKKEINVIGEDSSVIAPSESNLEQTVPFTEQIAPRQGILLEIPEQMVTPIASSGAKIGSRITWLEVCSAVWMGGCLLFMAVHWISYLRYKKLVIVQGMTVEEDSAAALFARLSEELHIRQPIQATLYQGAAGPMVIGFCRPMVVLPDMQYNQQELYFILRHELVHLKRRDACLKLLFVAANAVHWFNPVVWIMQREAVVDMELSCDERVVQGMDFADRKAYTETLFTALYRKYRHMDRTVLSTQFYGGKQVMKKRFGNILSRAHKKNGMVMFAAAVLLAVGFGAMIGCSAAAVKSSAGDAEARVLSVENADGQQTVKDSAQTAGVQNGVDREQTAAAMQTKGASENERVRQQVERLVQNTFIYERQSPAKYTDWRVESVTPSYTYQNFEGMVLEIYQFNYQFRTERPQEIQLLEGMQIDADGWVVTGCRDSNYLVYQRTGDTLIYLRHMFEPACVPGDEVFTQSLQYLYDMGELIPDLPSQEAETLIMTFAKEGFSIQDCAVCQNTEAYSIYLTEGEWARTDTDEWTSRRSGMVKLWITHFEAQSLEDVEKALADDGYAVIGDRRIRQEGDLIHEVYLKEFDGDVWGVFSTYPVDAQEGWGVMIRKMADTLLPGTPSRN